MNGPRLSDLLRHLGRQAPFDEEVMVAAAEQIEFSTYAHARVYPVGTPDADPVVAAVFEMERTVDHVQEALVEVESSLGAVRHQLQASRRSEPTPESEAQ